MRSPSEKKSQAAIKAATKLFLRNGYSATSMDMIAAEAGITKQTVYSHFSSKDALFTQMIVALCEQKPTTRKKVSQKNTSFEKSLFELGMAILDLITESKVLATTRLVISEAVRHPKLAQFYYDSGTQRLVQMIASFLDQQNDAGITNIENTASAASYFLSILKGQYYLRMILRVKPIPSEQAKEMHVRETVALFLHIYTGSQPLITKSIL